jgi:serine O-acetyltransferase
MTVSELLVLLRADLLRLYKSDTIMKNSGRCLWGKIIHPRFIPVLLIRFSQYFYGKNLLRPFSLIFSSVNVVFFAIEVTPRCKIGPGLLIPHTLGTVIGATEIGSNVTIYQGVTLGAKYTDLGFVPCARPILEDDVVIGAGAKVLGNIRIGRNTVIAANSLVTESVPDNTFAIGVPAVLKVRE